MRGYRPELVSNLRKSFRTFREWLKCLTGKQTYCRAIGRLVAHQYWASQQILSDQTNNNDLQIHGLAWSLIQEKHRNRNFLQMKENPN